MFEYRLEFGSDYIVSTLTVKSHSKTLCKFITK